MEKGKADDLYRGSMQSEDHRITGTVYICTELTMSWERILPYSSWPKNTGNNPPASETGTVGLLWTDTSIFAMTLWSLDLDKARIPKAVYKKVQHTLLITNFKDVDGQGQHYQGHQSSLGPKEFSSIPGHLLRNDCKITPFPICHPFPTPTATAPPFPCRFPFLSLKSSLGDC